MLARFCVGEHAGNSHVYGRDVPTRLEPVMHFLPCDKGGMLQRGAGLVSAAFPLPAGAPRRRAARTAARGLPARAAAGPTGPGRDGPPRPPLLRGIAGGGGEEEGVVPFPLNSGCLA